jgi:CRP-like cAMP-binding protein
MSEGARSQDGLRGQVSPDDFGVQDRARLLSRFGRRFASGETLLEEGAPAREAFLLQEGKVRLLRRVGPIDRSLAILNVGDLFGEGVLIEGASYGSTAVALTDGALLALDRDTFCSLLGRHPPIAMRVVDQLVRRLRDAEDQIEILMLRGVQSKVIGALLKLVGARTGSAEIAISPVELSTRVGLDVEAVKGAVQRLRDREYLRIQDEKIEIGDVEALRRLHVLVGAKDELAAPE